MTLQGIEILIAFVRYSGKLGLPPLKRTLYWREYPHIRLWQAHGFAAPAGKYLVMEDVYEDTEEEYIRFCAQRSIDKADALKILQRMYSRLKRLRIKGTRVDLEPLGTFFNKDDRLCFVPANVEWHESHYGLPIVQVEPFVHSAERKAMAARHAQDKKPLQRSTISYDPRQERFWMVALSFCLIAILIMGYAILQRSPTESDGSYYIRGGDQRKAIQETIGRAPSEQWHRAYMTRRIESGSNNLPKMRGDAGSPQSGAMPEVGPSHKYENREYSFISRHPTHVVTVWKSPEE